MPMGLIECYSVIYVFDYLKKFFLAEIDGFVQILQGISKKLPLGTRKNVAKIMSKFQKYFYLTVMP